jgi:Holliday junction DNA helicase RuvA
MSCGHGSVVLDVGGVGYMVNVPDRVLEFAAPGTPVQLHTYLHVRDSELTLYGALDPESMRWFQLLLGVSGVGPRLALAVLSAYPPSELGGRIETGDVAALTRVAGVGSKTAQRIILDIRGKLPAEEASNVPTNDEALLALTSLGYTPAEARAALLAAGADGDVEDRIRAALKSLGGA